MFEIFKDYPELVYGFSVKQDGNMRLTGRKEEDSMSLENRARYLRSRNLSNHPVVAAGIQHTANIRAIEDIHHDRFIPETDGLVTNNPETILTVTGADCFPVFLYDPKTKTIGLLHCGWRGIINAILKNAIAAFQNTYASQRSDIRVAIGPGIQACHFTFPKNPETIFGNYPLRIINDGTGTRIDLSGILVDQAQTLGIASIERSVECTYCLKEKYFSHRRDNPNSIQAMMAYILCN